MTVATSDNGEAPRVSQATYLKTSFLEALAHELRGPSGVTLGALDELELALGEAAKEHASLFAMARRGVRRVLRTTDRLSRTAQLEQSGFAATFEETDLSALVERASREAELVEARRGVKLEITRPGEPVSARVDATWLTAAIAEVVGAALRAAKRSVLVELQETSDSHRVIICDDGPMASLPRLRRFEPSDDRRDAGLAFPLVKEVIDAHRGELSLKNGETAGLLCVISLPAR
jgi:two-component system sensor histidine kinase TctE